MTNCAGCPMELPTFCWNSEWPGERVAVMLPKSTAQIAAVLGVKAGGVYVPLAHTRYSDGKVCTNLCRCRDFRRYFAFQTGIARGRGADHAGPDADRAFQTYCVASSRSEGPRVSDLYIRIGRRAKRGDDHREAANNTIRDINLRFGIGADDGFCRFPRWRSIFRYMTSSGCLPKAEPLSCRGRTIRLDPAHWLELMRRHEVTVWNTVPALLDILLDHLERSGETF